MVQSVSGSVPVNDLIDRLQNSQRTLSTLRLDELPREDLLAIIEDMQMARTELKQQRDGISIIKRALEIERRHFEILTDTATDGYLVTDSAGLILTSNPAAEKLFRCSAGQLTGRDIGELILFDVSARIRDKLLSVTENAAVMNLEAWCQPSLAPDVKLILNTCGICDLVTNRHTVHWQIQEVPHHHPVNVDEHERHMFVRAIYDTLRLLSETITPSQALDHALNGICCIAPLDFAGILLLQEQGLELVRAYGYSEGYSLDAVIAGLCLPDQTTSVMEYLIRIRKPLLITDEKTLSVWPPLPMLKPIRSMLAIPMFSHNAIIGAMMLSSTGVDFFTDVRVERFELFSVQATIAYQYAHWFQTVTNLAIRDERVRVARALHDSVNQHLFSMSIIIDVVPDLLETKPTKALEMLDQLRELSRSALNEMSAVLQDLHETAEA